jgi:acetolactate synthase-1/2/3 large subunit
MPEDHPLSVGASLHLPAAYDLAAEADVVFAVGTELAPSDWWDGPPSFGGTLIRVDVEADALFANGRPDLPIVADAAALVTAVVDALPDVPAKDLAWARAWRSRHAEQARAEAARWVDALDAIGGVLDRDAVVVADNAMVGYYGALGTLPRFEPGTFLFPTGFGTLGYAVPAAIGAALARPQRQRVALVGDGGLMFSVQELATAAAEGVCLPVVVFVNGGYGEIRAQMRTAGIDPLGVDLPVPDVPALAAALGGHGVAVDGPADLARELRAALARPNFTLIVVAES